MKLHAYDSSVQCSASEVRQKRLHLPTAANGGKTPNLKEANG